MANFKSHLPIAAAAGMGASLTAVNAHLITNADMPWLIFLVILGGLLPDIDASNSRPVKLLFNVLALLSAAGVLKAYKYEYEPYPLLIIAAATYLLIRFSVFALLMTSISYHFLHWNVLHAWLNGFFIALGFFVHLLLNSLALIYPIQE